MGTMSIWHWLMFLVVALLVFGGSGKISSIMGDVAKGIKSFKKGLADDDDEAKKAAQMKTIDQTLQKRRSATPRIPRPADRPSD